MTSDNKETKEAGRVIPTLVDADLRGEYMHPKSPAFDDAKREYKKATEYLESAAVEKLFSLYVAETLTVCCGRYTNCFP